MEPAAEKHFFRGFSPGLALRQCLILLAGIGVVAAGLFWAVRRQAVNMLTDAMRDHAFQIGESTVNRMDQVFFESARIAELLASRLGERRLSGGELDSLLRRVLAVAHRDRPEILALAVACEPGAFGDRAERMTVAQLDGGEVRVVSGGGYSDKEWYREPKMKGRGGWREPFTGSFVTEPIAVYSTPFYETMPDGSRKLAGVVCVDLSVDWVRRLISRLPIGESCYAYILSKSGCIVAHPRDEWVFRETVFSVADRLRNDDLRKLGLEMQSGKRGYLPYRQPRDGQEAWIYFQPLRSNGWSLGIVFPARELFAKVEELQRTFFLFGVAGAVLLVMIVALISIRITRPLKRLAAAASEIGRGNFSAELPELRRRDELGALAAAFRAMRDSLVRHIENLKTVTAAKERIESELKVAQEIQKGILPEILPPFPKCEFFEIDAFLAPAREVGGDLYDFFLISPTDVCLVIGDVAGKGVPASLFMAVTQTLHRGIAHEGAFAPKTLVRKMNQALCRNNNADLFVTYVFAVLDLTSGAMTYCNAGHNPFFLLKADGVAPAALRHGLPLGIDPDGSYGESELHLEPGDAVFFYTDGVTEAQDGRGEFFGAERLRALLEKACREHLSPAEIDETVRKALADFTGDAEPFDDITVLCLKVASRADVREAAGGKA